MKVLDFNQRPSGYQLKESELSDVLFGVQLARLVAMMLGVQVVGMSHVGMVRRLLMMAFFVGGSGVTVMLRGVLVVFGGLIVVLDLLFVGHDNL